MTNALGQARDAGPVNRDAWEEATGALLLMMAPIAPHISEELWQRTGRPYSIHRQPWPASDEALARDEKVTLVVQVNGKVRDRIQVAADISEDHAKDLAMNSELVKKYLEGQPIRKVIYVPGKLVNIVVR
jgi:leucyl-tRNA synthetase